MKRTRFLSHLLLLLVLPLAGCTEGTGPSASIEGTYNLQRVNGQNLPAIILDDAEDRIEILAGSLTLNSNGTWSDSHTLRATDKLSGSIETRTFPDNGTYSVDGSNLQLTSVFGGTFPAVRSGNTITVDLGEPGDPLSLTYRR